MGNAHHAAAIAGSLHGVLQSTAGHGGGGE
jgi:hypothetical protein